MQEERQTCLVTGGAGYVGGHTVLALIEAGFRVVILDDLSTGFAWSIPDKAKLVTGDIGDFELVCNILKTHQVRSILHFAAKTIVPDSFRDPLGYYLTNLAKTRTLVSAAISGNVQEFVFSSTAAVYSNSGSPVKEDQNIDPQSPYGRSKRMAESIIIDAATANNLRYAILRYFNVAGADPLGRNGQSTLAATHLIKVAVETALGKRPSMEIYGNDFPTPDGYAVRDYIHVSDLADAHVVALNRLRGGSAGSFIVNCGYGRGYSVKEVVEMVRTVSGTDFEVKLTSRRCGDLSSVVANSDNLKGYGWTPRFADLRTIVRHAYDWEKKLTAIARSAISERKI
jgi:UDP-glucose 4-epimerase